MRRNTIHHAYPKLVKSLLVFIFILSSCSNPKSLDNAPSTNDSSQTTIDITNSIDSTDSIIMDSTKLNVNPLDSEHPNALFSKTYKAEFSELGESDSFKITLIGPKAFESKLVFEIFNAKGLKIYNKEIPGREILKTNPNLKSEKEKIRYLKTEAEFFFDDEHFLVPAVMPDEEADENVPELAFHQELKTTKLPGFYFREGEESTIYIAWSTGSKRVKIYYKCCKK